MATEITNVDFVGSFLKAARARHLSVVVIYGETVGTQSKLKLTSNVGPEVALALVRQVGQRPPQDDDVPPAGSA